MADLALRRHLPSMAIDDPVHRGEPDARAGVIGGIVEPLKRPKQFLRVSHVKTRTVVANEVDRSVIARAAADFDPRLLGLRRRGTRDGSGRRQQRSRVAGRRGRKLDSRGRRDEH